MHRPICICSIYILPTFNPFEDDLDNVAGQLPTPFVILSDFNAHNEVSMEETPMGTDYVTGVVMAKLFYFCNVPCFGLCSCCLWLCKKVVPSNTRYYSRSLSIVLGSFRTPPVASLYVFHLGLLQHLRLTFHHKNSRDMKHSETY